jgi:site-specific DNA-cytosine methylase
VAATAPPKKRRKVFKAETATHRPALRKRKYKHDELTAVDLFSGFGGLTEAARRAGFTAITAANHNRYKVEVHEANHPETEHWVADLINPESADYHSARDLPAADLLLAGVTCTNHSQANTQKAYEQRMSLFDLDDPEFDERVSRSERDRATANCVLHYAEKHHPKLILVECTTELTSWGPAIPGRPKVGDGTTFKWWLKTMNNLDYKHKILYLNSQFFGVPQSRNRIYIVMWKSGIPAPDLEHRPLSWCGPCHEVLPAVWTWKTGIPPTGSVSYGKQYIYTCPRCRREVIPPMAPSINALDLTNLGTRIGDKPIKKHKDGTEGPMAFATLSRAERCRQRFAEFPAVLMPAKALRGVERHPWQPMATQTSQQETAMLSTGAVMVAAGNTYERAGSDCRSRDLSEPLWAQPATNTTALVTPPIAITGQVMNAHRCNGDGKHLTQPMDTLTTTHERGVLLAAVDNFQGGPRGVNEPLATQPGSETMGLLTAGVIANRTNATSHSTGQSMPTLVGGAGSGGVGMLSTGVMPYRQNTLPSMAGEPMPTFTAEQIPGLLTAAGTIKNNGSADEAQYRSHPVSDPLGTIVASGGGQGLLFSGWYKQNGSNGDETAPHPMSDPFGTLTARDTTALLMAEWRDQLSRIKLEDCYFRMLGPHEVGRGCGFDVDFPGHQGTFQVWGSARDQVDGFGNAVSPAVGEWICQRLYAVLHR